MFFILITSACFLLIFYVYFKNRNYWIQRNIVQVDKDAWHFIFGKCGLPEVYKKIYDNYPLEKYVGTFIGTRPVLVLRNLEDIQAVLQGDFQSFHGRGYKSNPKDVLSDNLLLIDEYERWKLIRQKMTPVFTTHKLKNMFSIMERCTEDFAEYIEKHKGTSEEIFEALHTFTSATIGATVFGINSTTDNTMESSILDKGWKRIYSTFLFNLKFALANIWPKLYNLLNLKAFSEHEDFFIGIMKEILNYRRRLQDKRHDFMDTCLELQNQGTMFDLSTGYRIEPTDEILAAQAFSFFIAGVDTTANSLNFTLMELSNHPNILKKLHDELDSILNNTMDRISYEDLKKMKYLDMIISESVRKYPPIGLMQRMCTKNTVLPSGGIKIENGSIVVVPIFGIHRDEKYYTNPEKFDPERFASKNFEKFVKFSYLPFGEGQRICLGKMFYIIFFLKYLNSVDPIIE